MVRAFSEISFFLTLTLVIVNFDVTTQNPEAAPQSGGTSNSGTEEAQPTQKPETVPQSGETSNPGTEEAQPTQKPETVPRSGETSNSGTEGAQPEPENLDDVVMLPEIAYSFTRVKDAPLVPPSPDVGLEFAVTDALYDKAIIALQELPHNRIGAYTGEGAKWEAIARFNYRWNCTTGMQVNAVQCKGNPRNFFIKQRDSKNYIIYYERLDA